jgi:hypothetical protein
VRDTLGTGCAHAAFGGALIQRMVETLMTFRSLSFRTAALALAAGTLLSLSAEQAQAHGGYRGHGGFGGPRVGVYFGAPIVPFYYGPRYYFPPPAYYYDYPPVVRVVPAPPVVYVERGDAQAPAPDYVPAPSASQPQVQPAPSAQPQPAQGPEWFFCKDSSTYYPYVRECASPWQRVPAQPSTGPR